LNLRQSCIFVHQNVPTADAENKMIEERQMFVETLDEMTKASADQENIADIQTFSQVCKSSVLNYFENYAQSHLLKFLSKDHLF
jgi:hypothetical protein